MIINKLNWVSAQEAPKEELESLNKKMAGFYSNMSSRQSYQEMIDGAHDGVNDPTNKLAFVVAKHIIENNFRSVLEIGCGSGKIFNILKQEKYQGKYTGLEMALDVIESNKKQFPEAEWEVGSVYEKCNYKEEFDCAIAFFVLEHLIYPELALKKMLDAIKPGGQLLLVFPDFSNSGIFPSQKIGWDSRKGTKEKLKSLKLIDAVVSYLEGRMLRQNLKHVNERFGSFIININPFCLHKDCKQLIPDVDAVYISNKNEIEKWAQSQKSTAVFPVGKEGVFASQSFIAIKKGQ
jgi:SAM-dependent methyltransferase